MCFFNLKLPQLAICVINVVIFRYDSAMTSTKVATKRKPGPRPTERVHLGARISPRTMQRIDVLVTARRETITATSKNGIVEELLEVALDALGVVEMVGSKN